MQIQIASRFDDFPVGIFGGNITLKHPVVLNMVNLGRIAFNDFAFCIAHHRHLFAEKMHAQMRDVIRQTTPA